MRRISLFSIQMLMILVFVGAAQAQKERFVGSFVNVDPNSGGITRLTLGADDTINVWGRCHPSDCDWGEETAYAYGSHVGADVNSAADVYTATYVKGFATKILLIIPMKDKRIRVDVFTRFTDRSRRSAFARSEIMVREDAK